MSSDSSAAKPTKPYPEFPLYSHRNGQWAKKIKGVTRFFGMWDDPDTALSTYLAEIHDWQAGRNPRKMGIVQASEGMTVAAMLNEFLSDMEARVEREEISKRHFKDSLDSCKLVTSCFGRETIVAALRAADFGMLRKSFPATWGAVKCGNEIQRIRSAFKWAFESELISALPNFGPTFKKPTKRVVRRAKQQRRSEHGTLAYSADELRALLGSSKGWLRGCILLGVNGGVGASDCGRLKDHHIDFSSGFYDLPRSKTGIERRFHCWKVTREAIQEATSERASDCELCFSTSHGKPVWWETESGNRCDNVSKMFRKLNVKLGIQKPGRSFYSLRRTFETVAGESGDQVAVDLAMGHVDESMGAVYRQSISDDRLIAISRYVEDWLGLKDSDDTSLVLADLA